ncbi:aldehyde dehydrogenase family protein [Bradyrhizobium sp. 1]|uniref:aldehyde dehydrogenase family protein n=1 Tax=Bradyrhizobium sp. 1 TaxID=241591 RepID=UPI001FF70983|nr:aldehyde dehydrogenase family protein [Bradyrhizobium sp. 1]
MSLAPTIQCDDPGPAVIKPAHQTALITAEIIKCLTEVDQSPNGVVNLVSEQGHEVLY